MTSEQPLGYRGLIVWQKSMLLTEEVYILSRQLPDSERFGLISQMQRSSVSIPCNIAEGYGRGAGDYPRHVNIARGSVMELETQLELCVRLKLLERDLVAPLWQNAQEISRMSTALADSLKK